MFIYYRGRWAERNVRMYVGCTNKFRPHDLLSKIIWFYKKGGLRKFTPCYRVVKEKNLFPFLSISAHDGNPCYLVSRQRKENLLQHVNLNHCFYTALTEKKVEPKRLHPWSRFMVLNSAPPLALFWCHDYFKGKNGCTLRGGTIFQIGFRVEPFWLNFFLSAIKSETYSLQPTKKSRVSTNFDPFPPPVLNEHSLRPFIYYQTWGGSYRCLSLDQSATF